MNLILVVVLLSTFCSAQTAFDRGVDKFVKQNDVESKIDRIMEQEGSRFTRDQVRYLLKQGHKIRWTELALYTQSQSHLLPNWASKLMHMAKLIRERLEFFTFKGYPFESLISLQYRRYLHVRAPFVMKRVGEEVLAKRKAEFPHVSLDDVTGVMGVGRFVNGTLVARTGEIDLIGRKYPLYVTIPFVVLSVIVVLVLVWLGFYGRKDLRREKTLLLLFSLLFIGACMRVVYAVFHMIGYGAIEDAISHLASDVVGRIGFVCFNLSFLVFTFFLISTLMKTFYPEKKGALLALKITSITLGAASLLVSVTLSVIKMLPEVPVFVFDASWIVLSATALLYAVALVGCWMWTIYLVRVKLDRGQRQERAMKNGIIMLTVSAVILMMFISRMVLICLATFVHYTDFSRAMKAVGYSCDVVMIGAISFYLFFKWRTVSWEKSTPDGYAMLTEEDEEAETAVPLRYQDF